MTRKKFDFLKLYVNFHCVAVKDTSCTIRLLAKSQLPPRASNDTCLKLKTILHCFPTIFKFSENFSSIPENFWNIFVQGFTKYCFKCMFALY